MYIYSTGLANNIKYLLNPDNIIDTLDFGLVTDKTTSEIIDFGNIA